MGNLNKCFFGVLILSGEAERSGCYGGEALSSKSIHGYDFLFLCYHKSWDAVS